MTRYRFGALLLIVLLAGCSRHHGGTGAVPKGGQATVQAGGASSVPAGGAPVAGTGVKSGSAMGGAPAAASGHLSEPAKPMGGPAPMQKVQTVRPSQSALILQPVAGQNHGAQGAGAVLMGTAALLPLTADLPLYPSDFEIGPLQPFPTANPQVDAVYRLAEGFFGQLAKGKVESEALSPKWRTIVERFLSPSVDDGVLPESIRIGTISIQDRQASARVRFERGEGRTTGTLYFDEIDGKWYLSDIQADLGKLSQPFVRKEQYQPESWQWLLSK